VTKGDEAIERAADRLDSAAQRAATRGGLRAKLGHELADDAAFLRKLKPSLIRARAKGEAPTDQAPGAAATAPSGPQLPHRGSKGGPSPFAVAGVALGVGVLLAKLVDWRGHAHPRR
jgi:hypothetical protein